MKRHLARRRNVHHEKNLRLLPLSWPQHTNGSSPPRFPRNAFGWKSDTPIQRIKEALTEIKAVAKKKPLLAAKGALLFLEKLAPAIEQVDSSSGTIGSAVNRAIEPLAPIIAKAKVSRAVREKWLDRLYEALQEDDMPYLEYLGEFWGKLSVTPEIASKWADDLAQTVTTMWAIARAVESMDISRARRPA